MYLDSACFTYEQLVELHNISLQQDNVNRTSTSAIEFVSRQHSNINLVRIFELH